jgi:hypothetical protein
MRQKRIINGRVINPLWRHFPSSLTFQKETLKAIHDKTTRKRTFAENDYHMNLDN